MVESVHYLLSRLLVRKFLQLDERLSLSVREAPDEQPVPPPPLLPWKLELLQLGDGRLDPLPADHLLHLGRRALDQRAQDAGGA